MKLNRSMLMRTALLISLMANLAILSSKVQADTGTCGGISITLPFNDVMASPFFCQIASAYYSGLTNGTTATTYSPTDTVTREQMAAFISRTMDQSIKRNNRRAVTEKWWAPQTASYLTLTTVGATPVQVKYDGADLWVANSGSGTVTRVRASDGTVLGTWTGASGADGIVCALGKVFIASTSARLYLIDPTQAPGAVTTLTTSLGANPFGIAFDGTRIWTTNFVGNSISIVTLNPTTVTTLTGFNAPYGVVYDGSNIWVTTGDNSIKKLDSSGAILQSISTGSVPAFPVFDGINIWVPDNGAGAHALTVIRVKDATGNPLANPFVLATLTGNGMNRPGAAAFDGERILVTNSFGDSVSLWKAADLTPLGSYPTGAGTDPIGACSDGLNFWIILQTTGKLARF